jgi:hypothetical protein
LVSFSKIAEAKEFLRHLEIGTLDIYIRKVAKKKKNLDED